MGNQQQQQEQIFEEDGKDDPFKDYDEEMRKFQEDLAKQRQERQQQNQEEAEKKGEEKIFRPNANATSAATPDAAGTKIEGDAARVLKKEAGGGPTIDVNNPDTQQIVFTAQNVNGVVSNFTQFPEHFQYKLNTKEKLSKIKLKDGKVVVGDDEEAVESLMKLIQDSYGKNQTELFNVQSGATASLLQQQKFLRDHGITLIDYEQDTLYQILGKIHKDTHFGDNDDLLDMSVAFNRLMALNLQQAVYGTYEYTRCFFQDTFSRASKEACKPRFTHPADEVEEMQAIQKQRLQLYEVSLMKAAALGLPPSAAQDMVNKLISQYMKLRGWPTNKVSRLLEQFNVEVSNLDGEDYHFQQTEQADQLLKQFDEEMDNYLGGKLKDSQYIAIQGGRSNPEFSPATVTGRPQERFHQNERDLKVIESLSINEIDKLLMAGGLSRSAANQIIITGSYKHWLDVTYSGDKAIVSLSPRYLEQITKLYTTVGTEGASVFGFTAAQFNKQKPVSNMTDDPLDKTLDAYFRTFGYGKMDITNAEKVARIAMSIVSGAVKVLTDSEEWKSGVYYVKCAAGLCVSMAALYGTVAVGGFPLLIGGTKFIIKSVAQLVGMIAKGIVDGGSAAVKGIMTQLVKAKQGVVGFSSRSLLYMTAKLHQGKVNIADGLVTIMGLMQVSTSRKLQDFVKVAVTLGGLAIQERMFRDAGDEQQVLLYRAKQFNALIQVADQLGFDDKLLRMYMFEKENIEKEYTKTYGNTGIFKNIGQKAVLSRERKNIQDMMNKFYMNEEEYKQKNERTKQDAEKLKSMDLISRVNTRKERQNTVTQQRLDASIKAFKNYQAKGAMLAQKKANQQPK